PGGRPAAAGTTGTGGTTTGGATAGRAFGGGGGPGGILGASTPSAALVQVLHADAASYRWVAAAVGSNQASGYQLATGDPVMAIGGFNGSDPSPTLAQFQADVAAGQIHYFAAGTGIGRASQGGSNVSSQISTWVQQNFTAVSIGGATFYDLTQQVAGSSASSVASV
ncbi:MAG: glycosyl transferase, partial [Actinomycetota bacterium]|nr:glycosyl transferase [Actinomycetota bacterium]